MAFECKYPLGTLVEGLTYDEYAAVDGLRASHLKTIRRSPAHLVAARRRPKESTEALEFGSLFHKAVENGEKFMDTYVVEPEFTGKTKDGRDSTRSAAAKEARVQWYAELKPGTLVVRKDWVDPLVGMLRSCMSHRLVGNLLRNGVRETSLYVEDPDTGELLQCRPDFISEKGYMVDLKSTRDATHPFFYHQIFSSKYDGDPFYVLQAAHYAHCARVARLSGVRAESFIIVAIEKEDPYGINVWPLDVGCIGPGEQWRAHLTALYARCKRENHWPCYDERAKAVTPPEWVDLPGEDRS